jgi:hypothetical protein
MLSDYHEDLRIPGIIPSFASSRNLIRDIPNARRYPFDRPVKAHWFFRRVGDEFRGSF